MLELPAVRASPQASAPPLLAKFAVRRPQGDSKCAVNSTNTLKELLWGSVLDVFACIFAHNPGRLIIFLGY